MRSTELRILRLEELLPQGCSTCFRWGPETISILFADEDGTETHPPQHPISRPETCPECGRDVPVGQCIVIRVRGDGPQ